MAKQTLEAQIAAFEKMQAELKKRYGPDEWVVFVGGEMKDHFAVYADAARYVVREFPSTPALVRRVESEPVFVPYLMTGA